jgi:hypothetical protein
MGPVSMQWYRDRGLTHQQTKTATKDTMFYNTGDTYTTESVIASYSCGRIDVRGIPGEPYGDEIGVPPMLSSDWRLFGDWLYDVQTMSIWTLDNLVQAYEHQTQNKITWDTHD